MKFSIKDLMENFIVCALICVIHSIIWRIAIKFTCKIIIKTSPPHTLSHWGGTNFFKMGKFQGRFKQLSLEQDPGHNAKCKIEGFFSINHWRPIALFTHSNNFNSEILIFYLSFININIYKYICKYIYKYTFI